MNTTHIPSFNSLFDNLQNENSFTFRPITFTSQQQQQQQYQQQYQQLPPLSISLHNFVNGNNNGSSSSSSFATIAPLPLPLPALQQPSPSSAQHAMTTTHLAPLSLAQDADTQQQQQQPELVSQQQQQQQQAVVAKQRGRPRLERTGFVCKNAHARDDCVDDAKGTDGECIKCYMRRYMKYYKGKVNEKKITVKVGSRWGKNKKKDEYDGYNSPLISEKKTAKKTLSIKQEQEPEQQNQQQQLTEVPSDLENLSLPTSNSPTSVHNSPSSSPAKKQRISPNKEEETALTTLASLSSSVQLSGNNSVSISSCNSTTSPLALLPTLANQTNSSHQNGICNFVLQQTPSTNTEITSTNSPKQEVSLKRNSLQLLLNDDF